MAARILPGRALAKFIFACLATILTLNAQTSLPFAGTDMVSIVSDEGKNLRVGGRIEDIQGETLTLRRSGNANIELYRMSTVTRLVFSRPEDWDRGLTSVEDKNYRRALEYFDKALRTESRPWAWNELQASAARICIANGQREEAVIRLEKVFEKDQRTRHVSLLPLVWDSELSDDERVRAVPDDLGNSSVIRQLIACSALLHQDDMRESVEAALKRIRRTSSLPRVNELAETQLWRLCLHDDTRQPLIVPWKDVVRQMSSESRGGPGFVLGCLQEKIHQYDNAALSFLWMPLMQPTDPALAASSMAHAIASLQKAGRSEEANLMKLDLLKRYPQTSAARRLKKL